MPRPSPDHPKRATVSQADRDGRASTHFETVCPIFRVQDLAASIDYYVRTLGFSLDWQQDGVASVSRDDTGLFLCQGDQGNPGAWVWIGVGDAQALYEEYRAAGATVRHPPTNFDWALEIQVEDLDGNVLRLGSAPLPDRDFGPWLDMRGNKWVQGPDGSWAQESADGQEGK
ncbi:MAG: VOC family protein [Gemmatimonadota bacterium]|nr:MAG: VOC family protein [Gemmatimonadota bacterium]